MSDSKNIFENRFNRFYCERKEFVLDYLSAQLQMLREDFIYYRKSKKLDSFEPFDRNIRHSYNKLLWKLKPNLSPIVKTNKDYFEARKQIFADYYNWIYNSKRTWNTEKKIKYFGETATYDVNEVRVHAKKIEVVHVFKPKLEPIKSVLFRTYLEVYVKCYFDFCQKHSCFNDSEIIRISPDNISISKSKDEFGYYCLEIKAMILIFQKSVNLKVLKINIKQNKDRVKGLFYNKGK